LDGNLLEVPLLLLHELEDAALELPNLLSEIFDESNA
jgi:hypothetical protein